MVAFAPCARTCRPDLPEMLVDGEFKRLRPGEQITVFVEILDDPEELRFRHKAGRFVGWATLYHWELLLLDPDDGEPPLRIPTHTIRWIERE